jgi:hypothetical protein
MTIHEAMIVKAGCDTEKDDCQGCCLSGDIFLDVGELGTFLTSPCALIQGAQMAVLSIPFPVQVGVPHAQG